MRRFQVVPFADDSFVVQVSEFRVGPFYFWENVTRAWTRTGSPDREFPLISRTFEGAVEEAKELMVPGAYDRHVKEQDAIYAKAVAEIERREAERQTKRWCSQ